VRLNSITRIVTTAEGPNHLSTSVREHFSPEPISLSSDRDAGISGTRYALIVVSATQVGYYIKLELWCIAVAVVRVTSGRAPENGTPERMLRFAATPRAKTAPAARQSSNARY
jgi:hypothetical protein